MTLTLPQIPEEFLEIKFLNENEKSFKQEIKNDTLPFAVSKICFTSVKNAEYLTKSEDVKSVIAVTLNLQGTKLNFEPGQTFGIITHNNREEVDQIIERLNLFDDSNKFYALSIRRNCNKKNAKIPAHVPIVGTIYNTLLNNLDIRSVPKKLFLRVLSKYTSDEAEKYEIDELCSKEGAGKYTEFITNSYMTLIEILKKFKSCMPPFSVLCEHLPKLQPRPYSVACVPNLQNELKFIFSIEELPNGCKGVCTGYLFEKLTPILNEEKVVLKIPIYLRKLVDFKLPTSISTNIILIATGTGIAPFMGFLEQRKFDLENNDHIGKITLFYGCRYSEKDFLFKDEINKYVEIGVIKNLYTSFSRENGEVKYVQDNIKRCDDFIKDIQDNCITFVCGKPQMCKDVFEIVCDLYAIYEILSKDEAKRILNEYKKSKKYVEDIWT